MTHASATPLHQLPASVDLLAMAVAALFGADAARLRHVPLFGVLLAGVLAGLGGGMARDVLLGLEPAAITNWNYIPTALATAVIGGSIAHRISLDSLPFVAAQGVAIGLLIGIGSKRPWSTGPQAPQPSSSAWSPPRSAEP